MDVVLDSLPPDVASLLRAQPPELLMLLGGLTIFVIVVVFHRSMRRW